MAKLEWERLPRNFPYMIGYFFLYHMSRPYYTSTTILIKHLTRVIGTMTILIYCSAKKVCKSKQRSIFVKFSLFFRLIVLVFVCFYKSSHLLRKFSCEMNLQQKSRSQDKLSMLIKYVRHFFKGPF